MASLRIESLWTITALIFAATVTLCIVFLKLRWYAFWIPIVGCVVVWGCLDIWNQLTLQALNA